METKKIKEALIRYVEINFLHTVSSEEIAMRFNERYGTKLTEVDVWKMLGRNK